MACSLFDRDAGASREALGYVTDLSITDRDEGLTLLRRLSLVSKADGRFRMLPIVQEYVREMVIGTEVDNVLTQRWLSWLLDFIRIHESNLNLYVERAPEIIPEYHNILSAIRWCRENGHKKTLKRLVKGIWSYPYLIGLLGELQEMLEAAIEAAEVPQEEQERGLFLRLLGQLFRVQGQKEKAIQYLEEAEKIARSYQDNAELGRILCLRLNFLPLPNQHVEAEQLAHAALAACRRERSSSHTSCSESARILQNTGRNDSMGLTYRPNMVDHGILCQLERYRCPCSTPKIKYGSA